MYNWWSEQIAKELCSVYVWSFGTTITLRSYIYSCVFFSSLRYYFKYENGRYSVVSFLVEVLLLLMVYFKHACQTIGVRLVTVASGYRVLSAYSYVSISGAVLSTVSMKCSPIVENFKRMAYWLLQILKELMSGCHDASKRCKILLHSVSYWSHVWWESCKTLPRARAAWLYDSDVWCDRK